MTLADYLKKAPHREAAELHKVLIPDQSRIDSYVEMYRVILSHPELGAITGELYRVGDKPFAVNDEMLRPPSFRTLANAVAMSSSAFRACQIPGLLDMFHTGYEYVLALGAVVICVCSLARDGSVSRG